MLKKEVQANDGQTGRLMYPVRWDSRHRRRRRRREEAKVARRYVLAASQSVLSYGVHLSCSQFLSHPLWPVIYPSTFFAPIIIGNCTRGSIGLPQQPQSVAPIAPQRGNFQSPSLIAHNQPRYRENLPQLITMATMAANDRETTQPTCQNCTTSTTPLWRRDEIGSVLCNACGLFLKLHGRPRPISLKTDVIKSRNRVKSSGSAQGTKKKASNGLLDPSPQSVQTLTRCRRTYSTPMASSRRDRKEEHHHPDPSATDAPHKNPQTAILMARTLPSRVPRRHLCMAICRPSTAIRSMTHTIIPRHSHSSIFVNHRQVVPPLPRTELIVSKCPKPTSSLSLRTPL
jgi:hypothetical protein